MKRFAKLLLAMTILSVCLWGMMIPAQAQTIVGNASVGEGVGKQTTLIDFSNADLGGFEMIGNAADPAFGYSEAWKSTVLKAPLLSSADQTGIRGSFASTSIPGGASSLSIQLLAQYTGVQNYRATLCLEGVDNTGAPIIWEGHTIATAGHWETVTFDISAFLASVNPDSPCTLTLLTSADTESDIPFTLFVKSIYINTPESFPDFILPVAAATCGFVIGFTFFFVIYRATCKRNRRPRWEEL